jgi:hypothetical protein
MFDVFGVDCGFAFVPSFDVPARKWSADESTFDTPVMALPTSCGSILTSGGRVGMFVPDSLNATATGPLSSLQTLILPRGAADASP